jgi:exosome complex RNA-binding protein Rrp42 (RNase PH superfamily)
MQTNIVPVAVYPSTANVLLIRSITLGPPPVFYYELQNVVVVPPVAEQLDPTTGAVLIAAQDEQSIVTVLKSGNVSMTEDQWDNWAAGPITEDEPYQLDCISTNLGLTRA